METNSRLDSVLLLSSMNLPGGGFVSGVTRSSVFSRGKKRGKPDLLERKKCSRLNQKSGSDSSGYFAYSVFVIGARF